MTKYIWMYEPVYISRADSPQFDERFIGYGLTRNTQVLNIHRKGTLLSKRPYRVIHSIRPTR